MYYYPNPYPVNPYDPYYGTYQPMDARYFPRQFPPVDTEQLDKSVNRFQELLKQADLLIDYLAHDKKFAKEMMDWAQKSNKERVIQLIRSTGVTIKADTSFTPTGIRIKLDNSKFQGDCCQLIISLRW